ncbi:lycopene cyclase family protein [Methylobacterium sp. 10]|uniref:NAD(P)/FAD-dependent oxidoreductase n=1 Tax=Methylobacterium sp. 10 TaxID=1101191 RepID=UPI0004847A57|nr:lycopene cyclase family protein [Methylobacterium sp. 10]
MDRIVVIGAGVAGLSAARRLALAGHSPVLVAPDRVVPSRGETLSATAVSFLDGLGWSALIDGDTAMASQGRFSIWGDSALRRATGHEHGAHIDRSLLEGRMAASLAESGLERFAEAAVGLEHLPRGVRIGLADGRWLDAAAVIDASGRAALSGVPAADRRRLDRLVCAYQVHDVPDDAELAAATLVEAVELGWWYMAPMPGRRMMTGLFTDSDLLPAGAAKDGGLWSDVARKTIAIAARLDSLGLDAACNALSPQVAPAASIVPTHLVEGRVLRSGDAAASLDPLGANGLSTALWSGSQAAKAALALTADDPAPARAYECAFLEGIAHHLSVQRSLYAVERRFTDASFWSRRHASP